MSKHIKFLSRTMIISVATGVITLASPAWADVTVTCNTNLELTGTHARQYLCDEMVLGEFSPNFV